MGIFYFLPCHFINHGINLEMTGTILNCWTLRPTVVEEIDNIIHQSISDFLEDEFPTLRFPIGENFEYPHEGACQFRFSLLLTERLLAYLGNNQNNDRAIPYYIDQEYHRAGIYYKTLHNIDGNNRFDIVIHRRGLGGINGNLFPENLVHLEIKGPLNERVTAFEKDIERILASTINNNNSSGVNLMENSVEGYQLGYAIWFKKIGYQYVSARNGEVHERHAENNN